MPLQFRHPLLALIFCTLAACGGGGMRGVVDPLARPKNSIENPVVVSVTSNSQLVYDFNWLTIVALKPGSSPDSYTVSDNSFALQQLAGRMGRDSAVFVGSLPPGAYMLESLLDQKTGRSLKMSRSGQMMGEFVVPPGQPVDLGSVLVSHFHENEGIVYGRSTRVTSNKPVLELFSPRYARLFDRQVSNGWQPGTPTTFEVDAVEQYALQRPVGAACVTELNDGRVVAASRLNTVLMRGTDKQWRTMRGPGLASLLCVTAVSLPDAELLAVGEMGTLLRKAPGAAALSPVKLGNLPAGTILGIQGSVLAGWFAAVQLEETIALYHSPQLENGTWSALRNIALDSPRLRHVPRFWMWSTRDGFGYSGPSGPMHFYHFNSKTWTARQLPGGGSIEKLAINPGGIYTVMTANMLNATLFISKDGAASWQKLSPPPGSAAAAPVRTPDGLLLATQSSGVAGMGGSAELYSSKDDGQTWKIQHAYGQGSDPVALSTGGMLDVKHDNGLFLIRHSSDGGRSWQVEYNNKAAPSER